MKKLRSLRNSGVILSLLFKGIAEVLKESEEVDGVLFADALTLGVEYAYKAVMNKYNAKSLTACIDNASLFKDMKKLRSLSQSIFRSITSRTKNNYRVIFNIKSEEVDGVLFADALTLGVEYAYKAVMNPTEGTILTVARLAAEAARIAADVENDPIIVLGAACNAAEDALAQTTSAIPLNKSERITPEFPLAPLSIAEEVILETSATV